MLRRPVMFFSLVLALSACTPQPPQSESSAPVHPGLKLATSQESDTMASVDAQQMLTAYHWQLQMATAADGTQIAALFPDAQTPIQLDFIDSQISISHACNRMNGGYRIDGSLLRIDQMASTLMGCPEPLMAAQSAISERLNKSALALALSNSTPPTLTLTTERGDVLSFQGKETPETRFGSHAERVFLEIAPERVACHHPLMPEHTCLHVREITYDDNGLKSSEGKWQFFYDAIEGYTHEAGIRNILRLKRYHLANPPADGASQAYVLDMVVMSEKVDSEKVQP